MRRAWKSGALRSEGEDKHRRFRESWLDDWVRRGTPTAMLLVVALLAAAFVLTLACRLGFEPARDAMNWLTHGHPVCAEHPRRQRPGALLALPASKPPPAFAVLFDELDDEPEPLAA